MLFTYIIDGALGKRAFYAARPDTAPETPEGKDDVCHKRAT